MYKNLNCSLCGKEDCKSPIWIKAHLAGIAGYGIVGCKCVDDQVRSKALPALKGKRAAKSRNTNPQSDFSSWPQPPQSRAVDSYLQPQNLVNAEVEEPNTEVSQGYGILRCENVHDQVRSEAHAALGVKKSNSQGNVKEGPHLPVTVNNEDAWRDTSSPAMPIPSSDVKSTVGTSPSAFLLLPETNLPNQSLPTQNMNPQRDSLFWPQPPQSYVVDSDLQPQNLSNLISQQDLVPEDLTNMLPGNAEEEEPHTEVPQGYEGRIDNIRSNDDQLTKLNSLPDGCIGWSKIGKISVSSKAIGKGSNGTIVFEGEYDGRRAAVKRLVRGHLDDVARNEIDILIKSDRHKNIVRYYGKEEDQHFVYLALELCICSLDELYQVLTDSSDNSAFPGDPASTDDYKIKLDSIRSMTQDVNLWQPDDHPSPLLLNLMRDMVLGLSHLHDLRIIHRDLKPQNVLITYNQRFGAQLSDMGIGRCLLENKSSLGYHNTGCGTSGWRAPEVLLHGGRQMLAMDLFSLGCVLFFYITRGRHPFGDHLERDHNIAYNKMDLSLVEFIPEAHDLISCLLNQHPKLRPKASVVLRYPFFWSPKMKLSFLRDVSDKVELEVRAQNSDLLKALENIAQLVFDGNWDDKIETEVMTNLRKHRTYDGSCVRGLLRAVRNILSHRMEASKEVKEILGTTPKDLNVFFAKRFPRLLIESYRVVSQICKEEECFQEYF